MLNKTLAWWDSNNFGDALNPYIFRAFGVNVSYQQSNTADALALGSLMERIFKGAHTQNETYFSPKPIAVWGAGVHFESGKHIEQPDIEIPEKLIRDANFLAVRGKATKERIEKVLDRQLPKTLSLGDPGLLVNKIIKESKQKKYDLGIVAHFHDTSSELILKINNDIPNSIILDVKSDPLNFIKKLTECRAIISTAMHPIIVADSYGIPNIWATTGNSKISSYKYEDYYSVFDISPAPVFNLDEKDFNSNDLDSIKSNYKISREQVIKIQGYLITSFPFSPKRKEKLKRLNMLDIAYLRWRAINRDYRNKDILRRVKYFLSIYMK